MDVAALILAAGKGTRLNSRLPKPLHQVGGRPMLAWSLDAARAAGAGRTALCPVMTNRCEMTISEIGIGKKDSEKKTL